ncbi:hypothetical protein OZ411_01165 [Bradyrhizobium sp. Arg237L]|uniref:hypothetical protein n=1 Tax=Bradyrhizobium sp. Arg237L TaxID=3003352 RepID=UPI00249DA8B4|nr:hypothetical protein [Bradyrhizobium sp. Arg237L]MDI4231423.1 hypothetical protein [Bradyrhizobium sp. Arg237L]
MTPKADAEKLGQRLARPVRKEHRQRQRDPTVRAIRSASTELIDMNCFSRELLEQWIRDAHAVSVRSFTVAENILRGQERALEADPAKLSFLQAEKPSGQPN